MKEIDISGGSYTYKVYIDESTSNFNNALKNNDIQINNKFFIITDHQVHSIYRDRIGELFEEVNYKVLAIPSGENNKNFNTIESIYKFLMENSCDRSSTLVAFGGGIVGDLVGYVAATYMRGMKYISIPTTIISMVDSSVGGKVGYNFENIKNVIGTFYTPIFVFISIDFLRTLPNNEFINGIAEVVKYGVIKERQLLYYLEHNLKSILSLDKDKLFYIIEKSLRTKHEVVSVDFKDKDYRNILNFGHTIGHGIEIASNHGIAHGYAVALGMLVELKLSQYKLNFKKEDYDYIYYLMNSIGFPTKYKVDNMDLFMYAIKHDKKTENNQIKFSLVEEIGISKTGVVIDEGLIEKAMEESIERRYL